MSIREKYVGVVESIAIRANILSSASNYRISAGASRSECIRYALRHVVRHSKPHYRYDRYRVALSLALHMITSRTDYRGPQLHIDVGCGPGLFTWVVRDWLRHEQFVVDLYGYDHASEMVNLATEIWTELDESVGSSWHDDADEMLSSTRGISHDHSLVTFGHVLAQTHDQEHAIQRFGQIISHSVAVNCLVVAVDAYGASTKFRIGCDRLKRSLLDYGLRVEVLRGSGARFIANVTR